MSAENANIAVALGRRAIASPNRLALIDGRTKLSFLGLDEGCARLSVGLSQAGIKKGMRAAVLAPPGVDFYALAFALMRLGAVPVLIDPGIGWERLGRALAEAAPQAFIGTPKAHLARAAGGWARETVRIAICAGGIFPGALSAAKLGRAPAGLIKAPAPTRPEDPAAILFTSGSTGAPKGAVYTHGVLNAQLEMLAALFSISAGEVSVPTFPLFGLFDVALGQTVVIPDMDASRPAAANPRKILDAIVTHRADQLFGSPALLDVLARHGKPLPYLKRVLSAGAPVPAKLLARLKPLLPEGCRIYTPYGATEALPVACIEAGEVLQETGALAALGLGTCVGRPAPGVELAVIRIDDHPIFQWSDALRLPPGEIGELAARGPNVTARYHERPDDTALAKIPAGDGTFWHRMGDLGYLDEKGRVWFCGRKSQRVETPQRAYYTIPCEGVFDAHPKVRRTALVGAGAGGASFPVLCVELDDADADVEAVRRELLALGAAHEHTKGVQTILFHPRFPVDVRHNAKIGRERLADWARQRVRA